MTYFVIQVKTGTEGKYLQHIKRWPHHQGLDLIWPRRRLRIRRRGRWQDSLAPIFPGYLFLETELITPRMYWTLKRVPGFLRFLKDNHHIEPLSNRDREILIHFLSYGEIVDRSLVTFDENKRIRVIRGPLKSLEGKIVKVDRRKSRAKVRLELYESSFLIDFGFDALEEAGREKPASEQQPKERQKVKSAKDWRKE